MESNRVKFKATQMEQGDTYEVYIAATKQDALEFLRVCEVKESKKYVIVETPEGSIGKDLIAIFDENSGKTLELGKRKPLQATQKSSSNCSRCGYFTFPTGSPIEGCKYYLSLENMQEKGQGFYCGKCQTVWCSFCVTIAGNFVKCPICGLNMKPYGPSR